MRKILFTISSIVVVLFVFVYSCRDTSTSSFTNAVPEVFTLAINITPDEGGIVIPSAGEFLKETSIKIEAQPAEGWIFDGWEGDLEGNENPVTITIDDDKNIIAMFDHEDPTVHFLTVETDGEGTVDVDPDQETYEEGDEVTVTADPAPGWTFLQWQGDLSGTENPATIVMGNDKSIIAVFEDFGSGGDFFLRIVQQPGETTAGEAISPHPVIEIIDSQENPVTGMEVTVSEQGSHSFDGGTLTVTTGDDGQALFDDLVINRAGSYTLVFAATDIDREVTSDTFEVTNADGEPGQTTATVPDGNTGEPTRITITVEDQFGNRVTGEAGNLSVSVSGTNEGAEVEPINDDGNGVYTTSYTPEFIGLDEITIQLNGTDISGSPFVSIVTL